MAVTRRKTAQLDTMPADLVRALEDGALTDDQLVQLITIEAAELGLSFDEAVQRARDGSLPKNLIGLDLEMLVSLLPS